jgi:murein DD-endopeptidase MepM/ murein hydrolase activator NlpD
MHTSGTPELRSHGTVPNPIPPFVITCPWGTPGDWAAGYHTGDDYSTHGRIGVPVRATHGGRVVAVGNHWGTAYGLHVVVIGQLGIVEVGYCHLSSSVLRTGQRIRRGELVGLSGNTGRTSGPHLHYEERRPPWRYSDNRRPRFNREL